MIIPERFTSQINVHLLGNMLEIKDYPLILAIMGTPGMGKTFQLRTHLELLGIEVLSISSADLESERAGAPAKLLKQQYINASAKISQKIPSALVIDDIDTTVGEWEQNTGTVNHQSILAFLMHIADNPYYIESLGKVNRVPVFFTGNKFDLLYEPLRRPGRTRLFEWEPYDSEKIEIISESFKNEKKSNEFAKELVALYPKQPISFFTSLFTAYKIRLLGDMANNAMFKCIVSDSKYKKKLNQMYDENCVSMDWEEFILSERRKRNADYND